MYKTQGDKDIITSCTVLKNSHAWLLGAAKKEIYGSIPQQA